MEVLNNGRFGMSSCLAGTMRQLTKRAAEFAYNRKQFNDKIYNYGAIQEKLARMAAEQYAVESVAYLISQVSAKMLSKMSQSSVFLNSKLT